MKTEKQIEVDAAAFVNETVKDAIKDSNPNPQQEKKEDLSVNALNEMSLAALFELFSFSRGACYLIMKKMNEFSTFQAFLQGAFGKDIKEFLPALGHYDDEDNNVKSL